MNKSSSKKLLSKTEVASKAGILISKVSFYEGKGLLESAEVSTNGQKLYIEEPVLLLLKRIKKLTDKRFSLEQIKGKIGCSSQSRKIMVIDDEREVVDLVKDALSQKGNFEVIAASDGFEAGALLGSNFPDLIVLDLNLPGINGFELCKVIRQDKLQAGVKILAVTGYYNQENAGKIMEYGVDGLMEKPFNLPDFIDTVFKLLGITKSEPKQTA